MSHCIFRQTLKNCLLTEAKLTTVLRKSSFSEAPKSADVVIIGGGIIGHSVAFHLVDSGLTNVVLVEKHKLTSGTTWHTNGCLWRLRPSTTDIELLAHTRYLLTEKLVSNPDVDNAGWTNNGGLFLAHSEARMTEYRRLRGLAKYYGIEAEMVDLNSISDLVGPLLDGGCPDLIGGLYSPGDGHVDPTLFCDALKKAARKGLKIFEDSEAVAISTKQINGVGLDRKINGVTIKKNEEEYEIKTDVIVNAAGSWAPLIAKLVDERVKVPQETMEHSFVITEPMPDLVSSKTPNIRDHDLSMVTRTSGQSLCIGGYEPNPKLLTRPLETLQPFGLFELDWSVFEPNLTNTIKLIPKLAETGIRSTVCGPESFTPDHRPLLGEDPIVAGFYHASGFNSFGINLAGGCGRELANWILKGRPDIDMTGYDIRRFNRDLIQGRNWIQARSIDVYAHNYDIIFPFDQCLAGRQETCKDPLYDELLKKGAVYEEIGGLERPAWFDTEVETRGRLSDREYLQIDYSFKLDASQPQWKAIKKECLEGFNNAAVFNLSSMGKFLISGRQSQSALNWLTPTEINSLNVGSSLETILLNAQGMIQSLIRILKLDSNQHLITCFPEANNSTFSNIKSELTKRGFLRQDVEIENVTSEFGMLSLQGPKSKLILEKVLKSSLDFSETLSKNVLVECQNQKIKVILTKSRNGFPGFDLLIPSKHLKAIYQKISQTKQVTNAGWRAFECLSASKNIRYWSRDIGPEDSLADAGMESLISSTKLNKEAFVGAKAIKNHANIPKKKICYLTIKNKNKAVWGSEPIYVDGEVAGLVRRGSFDFINEKPIAIGYLSTEIKGSAKSKIEIEIDGKLYEALFIN